MKLFVYVIVVLIGGSVLAGSLSDLTGVGWLEGSSFVLSMVGLVSLPIAVGIAILRYRLYEIDIIINRTLVYGSLTALLVALYHGGVTATQSIFRTLTGQQEQPQLAIVVSTLVIAALFTPLRRRIQSFIDRRFYRSKYNARKTLEGFSATLRDETDLEALSNDLVGVVRETMQPAHVSLWLRPDKGSKDEQGGLQLLSHGEFADTSPNEDWIVPGLARADFGVPLRPRDRAASRRLRIPPRRAGRARSQATSDAGCRGS